MFGNPASNLSQLQILPATKVADFGAGAGAYTLELARLVGPQGKVFALEVQREMLTKLKSLADNAGRRNVEIVLADLEVPKGSKLADNTVSLVLIANVLFQATQPEMMLAEARRVVEPGGRVAVIDWQTGRALSPRSALSPERIKQMAERVSLKFEREFGAGDNHFGLIFRKD